MNIHRSLGLVSCLLLATGSVAAQTSPKTYVLKYHFKPGQVLDYQSKQSSNFNTTIQGQSFKTTSELHMVKRWKVLDVSEDRFASIEVTNLEIRMRSNDGTKTIDVDSLDPKKQPAEFANLLSMVGKPLGVVTVSPAGAVSEVKRLIEANGVDLGLGSLFLPLPEEPVAIGDQWQRNYTLKVVQASQAVKEFTMLQKYTLEGVEGEIATVRYKTVLIDPINDPQLEVHLVQQQPAGTFEFDLQRGIVVAHSQDLEKTVVGCFGPGTAMELAIHFRERLKPVAPTAKANP